MIWYILYRSCKEGREMIQERQLFTPAEAAKKLSELSGREINVNRLAQLRRAGKVKAIRLGYNETVYTLEDLEKADVSLGKVGRKPRDTDQDESIAA